MANKRKSYIESTGSLHYTADSSGQVNGIRALDLDLDTLVRIQDALDAMDDTSCITRDEFIECNQLKFQPLYAAAWDAAKNLIREHGSLRKAANHVEKQIKASVVYCSRWNKGS